MPIPADFEFPHRPGHPVAREESTSWPDRVDTTTLDSGHEAVLVEGGYSFLAIFWHGDSAAQLWAARRAVEAIVYDELAAHQGAVQHQLPTFDPSTDRLDDRSV